MLPAGEEEFDKQSEQIAGPNPALYWFIMQTEHVSPFAPVYPALHSQEVFIMLATGDEESDGQSEQVAGPRMGLYWPDTQEEQTPSVPIQPALQIQECM